MKEKPSQLNGMIYNLSSVVLRPVLLFGSLGSVFMYIYI